MPQLATKRRSLVARTAVLAVIASMLVVGAAPVGAATAACPSTIPSAGFADLGGLSTEAVEAVNCIKYYGVTQGTSATTFSPYDDTVRYQMALFLTRTIAADGLGLPSGSDQGFTDLGGLSTAAVTAINQLKQLGVTTGLTATTFGPQGDVLRYEMALFITRTLTAAGLALPSGADQGFTDLAGVSASGVTAINQLKQLGISTGTTATTYDPFGSVTRWQMALFLARSLNALGVTPAGIGVLNVQPSASASLTVASPDDTTDDRAYTVSGLGTGTYTIALFPAANITVSGSSVKFLDTTPDDGIADGLGAPHAAVASITRVNGAAVAATGSTTASAVAGTIAFTVDGAGAGSVTPVVFIDAGAAGLNLNSTDNPTEAFGVGGTTTFSPTEGAAGAFGPAVITSVDKTADVIVAGGASWFYDSNDSFSVGGVPTTAANFETQLSSGDTVSGTYADSPAAVTTWNLTDSNPVTPVLNTAVVGTAKVTLTWTPGSALADIDSFSIFRALSLNNTDCSLSESYAQIATSTDLTAPHTYVDSTVGVPEQYCYRIQEVNDGDASSNSNELFASVTAADASAPTIIYATLATDGGLVGVAGAGDVHKLVFSEVMAAGIAGAGSTFRVADADGTILDIACNTGCSLNAALETVNGTEYAIGRVLTVVASNATITSAAAGTVPNAQYPLTITNVSADWDDLAGNQLNLAGSADKVID